MASGAHTDSDSKTIDSVKLSELKLREAEVRLKQSEVDHKINLDRSIINPVTAGLWVAVVGIFGNIVVTAYQGNNQLALEDRKFQSSLVISAMKDTELEKNQKNLRFLVDAQFITNPAIVKWAQTKQSTEYPSFSTDITVPYSCDENCSKLRKFASENTENRNKLRDRCLSSANIQYLIDLYYLSEYQALRQKCVEEFKL